MQVKNLNPMRFYPKGRYNLVMHPGGRPTDRKRNVLGQRIVQARERAGLSQYDLADKLGVTQQCIVQWERKALNLRSDTLIKLCEVLGLSSDELLGLNLEKRPGKGRQANLFEAVSELPRTEREKVLDMLEDTIIGQQRRLAQKQAS